MTNKHSRASDLKAMTEAGLSEDHFKVKGGYPGMIEELFTELPVIEVTRLCGEKCWGTEQVNKHSKGIKEIRVIKKPRALDKLREGGTLDNTLWGKGQFIVLPPIWNDPSPTIDTCWDDLEG